MSGRRVNLDELLTPAGEVTLAGDVHPVLPLDGAGYQAIQGIDRGQATAEDLVPMYEAVGRCVPTLTPEQLAHLRPVQVGVIIGIACAPIEEVEASLPKARRATTRPSRSNRRTRSASSSSASPSAPASGSPSSPATPTR